MRYERTVNITELLANTNLSTVIKKGLFLNELNQKLQGMFPVQYQGYYRVADLQQESLILEVANASVRQALLFQQTQLLQLTQLHFPAVKKICFQINPDWHLSR